MSEGERRVADKTRSIDQLLDDQSSLALQQTLENFENEMKLRRSEFTGYKQRIDTLNEEISQLRKRSDELNLRRGQAMLLQDQVQQQQSQQHQICVAVHKKYNLPLAPGTDWNGNIVQRYLEYMMRDVSISHI